jgi:hypothetical protein
MAIRGINPPVPRTNARRIIVVRNAPDWAASARLWLNEKRLDPALFLPQPLPPGFPKNTISLIELWNRLFAVDFFSMRQSIRDLAFENFAVMAPDQLITQETFENSPSHFIKNSILFFSDDDDFACPDLFDQVARHFISGTRCVRWSSISVGKSLENRRVEQHFPRLRPWILFQAERRPRKLGFLRPLVASRAELPGVKNQLAVCPLHTNNYMLDLSDLSENEALRFIDHLSASSHLWRSKLKVKSLEWKWLSFTNKHPASITAFNTILKDTKSDIEMREKMADYITAHRAIKFPEELSWMRPYHGSIAAIYQRLLEF